MLKKRNFFILVLLTLLLTVILWIVESGKAPKEGELYIKSPQDLIAFSESVNQGNTYEGVHVILTRDIDMGSVENFIPIGIWRGENYFRGIFDGNGHVICNLTILPYDESGNIGLFGTLGGIVCNLILENCYVQGNVCGVICCISDEEKGRIYNCEIRNCLVDAEETDIIGGQFFGEKDNCVIDGYGDLDELNKELWPLSERMDDFPLNLWKEENGKIFLSEEKANLIADMRLQLNAPISMKLKPFCGEEDGLYRFVLPGGIPKEGAELTVTFLNGDVWYHTVTAEDTAVYWETDGYRRGFAFTEGGTLPSVHLTTEREDVVDYLSRDKNLMLPGSIQIIDEDGGLCHSGKMEHVKARGNNSFYNAPKVGYSIKLKENADLLGLGTEKDFALLPGYRDASLITYRIIQDLSEDMDFDYALSSQFVDLYFQGEYMGVYLLSEKMEIGSNRIDIGESSVPEMSGYLYELNIRGTLTVPTVTTKRENIYGLRGPVNVTQEQLYASEELWNDFEDALFSPDGINSSGKYYTDYMDLESLAKQWLLLEACGEYSICSSIYYYKEPEVNGDGMLHALPPWDVEHSFTYKHLINNNIVGDFFGEPVNGFWGAMQQHGDFKEAVSEIWYGDLRPLFSELLGEKEVSDSKVVSLDAYAETYSEAMARNELLWGVPQNLEEKIENIRWWVENRMNYMDQITDEFLLP